MRTITAGIRKEKAKPQKSEFEVITDTEGNLCFNLEQTENQVDFITIKLTNI